MNDCMKHSVHFLIAAWLFLTAGLAYANLGLSIEANPDPAEPGEVLQVQLTVTNPDGFDRSGVVLRMVYPVGLQNLSQSAISDGGTCAPSVSNNGRCDATELLSWNLGTIPAGTGVTVSLPPTVDPTLVPGSTILFEPQVEDSTATITNASRSLDIINDRALELLLTEVSQEPVTAGGQLTYQLSYGHTATSAVAPSATLSLPVPAGLSFVSADGGGTLSGGTVQWALGTLVPGQVGERRVIFSVDGGAAAGTVYRAESVLQDTGGQLSRADAVTRVEAPAPLQLMIEANPNPAEPGEVLGVELTVTNSSFFDRADVVLQMRYPVGLQNLSQSAISDGGTCVPSVSNNGRCDATELLSWNLGTIPAGTGVTVSLPPSVNISAVPGSLIAFGARVTDSSGSSTQASEVVEVINDRALELLLTEVSQEPVTAGGQLTYQLSYGHTATSAVAPSATLSLPVPAGLSFVSADGGGTLSGGTVQWALGTLVPGQVGERRVIFSVDGGAAAGTVYRAESVLQDTGGQLSRADAVTRVEAPAPLQLMIEANPNPAEPGEVLGVELTVTNSSFFDRADVVLQMRYPVGLQNLSQSAISDGGTCVPSVSNNGRCDATELLSWNLGTIPAGTGVTVSLPPSVNISAVPGSLIAFGARVTDSSGSSTQASEVVEVINDRALELVLSEAVLDPALPGNNQTYVLNWGYSDSSSQAAGTTLELGVPQGLTFVSADAGGVLSGDKVQWTLGTLGKLEPGQVGERSVTFNVNAGVTNGTLARVEATMTTGSGQLVRADAVTRFESETPLNVTVDATANPSLPGDTLSVALTVTNSSFFDRADVVLQMRYPVGLQNLSQSAISDGGTCVPSVSNNGRCDATELLSWNLGTILAGGTVTVNLPPVINAIPNISKGQQIEFVAWVGDSVDRSRAIDVVGVGYGDTDGDGVLDNVDNCIEDKNPGQQDTNGDDFGNRCDPDLNGDLRIDFADLAILKSQFFATGPNMDADLNSDDRVDFADLAIMKSKFFGAPGPSAVAP
ncbi:MAG: hypothetical protein BMS9Abin06_0628 [Gammaproteobacteria bacterium]|nr:MAG: hypothetical protein BMS9Abin06_0628 [Gammaproteobacteria bacterium]